MQNMGLMTPATFTQNRLNRQAFFQNLVMQGSQERIRKAAIEEAKAEQKKLQEKADKGGIWGGVTGAIGGGITSFFSSGGNWGAALLGAAQGGVKGYEAGRQTAQPEAGALLGAAQGLTTGFQEKQRQDALLRAAEETKFEQTMLKKQMDIKEKTYKLQERSQELEEKKHKFDVLESLKETTGILNETTLKEVIKKTGEGFTLLEDIPKEKIDSYPKKAFITIGYGDEKVKLLKPPVELSNENSTKLSILTEGRDQYAELLNEVTSGGFTAGDIRAAATKGLGINPRLQPVKNKLEFMVEALSRGLSGAAISKEEMDRFRGIFSVKALDSDSEIINKLNRAILVADKIENMVLYGATASEKRNFVRQQISNKPKPKKPTFFTKDKPKPKPKPTPKPSGRQLREDLINDFLNSF